MFQVLSAVTFLHEIVRIAHRDIKPSNILFTLSGRVQLTDFGISWKEGENLMYFEVSTGYAPPDRSES